MKRIISLFMALSLLMLSFSAFAETTAPGNPPQDPAGMEQPSGTPPAMPDGSAPNGTPPDMPNGSAPQGTPPDGTPPDGFGGGNGMQGGMPGGMPGGNAQPQDYQAVQSYSEDTMTVGETILSAGTDENAVLVTAGNTTLNNVSISRTSADSTGGDSSSFYGVGAAALVTGGTLTIEQSVITTDSAGGAGVFAYGDGVAYVSDSTITTAQNTSGGIHVAGGGTLFATDVTVVTEGESSAAIRSDRGGGTMVVDGGSYTANGVGSPAVYVTADISVSNAALTANGSEALCLEGKNSVVLNNCSLQGNMKDLSQNDNTWTVILYQSMSGDSEIGKGTFTMNGGTLTSLNGGMFYTTNTTSEFTLNHVELVPAEDAEYLLRCTGNTNQRGWGTAGSNGADCTFTAIEQEMSGDVLWDSISSLQLNLTEGTLFTGAIVDDESCAGEGGSGSCTVTIDDTSTWIVTGDSCVSVLNNEGTILDAEGNTVSVIDADGTVLSEGTSPYTIRLTAVN